MIYVNIAMINWFSKNQSTIETSVFGAEFVALKTGVQNLRGIRYKLRMMGVPIEDPTYIYGVNNQLLITPPSLSLFSRRRAIQFAIIL